MVSTVLCQLIHAFKWNVSDALWEVDGFKRNSTVERPSNLQFLQRGRSNSVTSGFIELCMFRRFRRMMNQT